jgi:transcriptional regulator with XRE-family HTH domain
LHHMTTIYDPRYVKLIEQLVKVREDAKVTQAHLATALGIEQSMVSKVENFDRRLDIIELYDWLSAIGYSHKNFLRDVGWLEEEGSRHLPAMPIPGKARRHVTEESSQGKKTKIEGTLIEMAWQGQKKEVFIADMPANGYLKLESEISVIYKSLNDGNGGKNREAILQALTMGIDRFPNVNPSDIYHHIVYRLYLRDYTKTQADRSWVRAGGEAFELFLQSHYNTLLNPYGIFIRWLYNDELKATALKEMSIQGEVGGSKLDIALYGLKDGHQKIFGGIHAKASLAERVSDDVPCSEAMMRKSFFSYLVTFDAKSFPPPNGDLVNRGELGTIKAPSDKRAYIESHGSFNACFSYNLRTVASGATTKSGRKIFVSTFNQQTDPLPGEIVRAWAAYQALKPKKK